MPSIETLPTDILTLLGRREGTDLVLDEWVHHGANMTAHIHKAISEDTRGPRPEKTLFASEIGTPCTRKLWYKVNSPETALDLPPWTKFKFLYGNLIEETLLALAKASGHVVTNEQMLVTTKLENGWEIRGRIDATIDGRVVDVKSMSPYSFDALKQGLNYSTDKFGYRHQVSFYSNIIHPGAKGYILGADKVNGHIWLAEQELWRTPDIMHKYLFRLTDLVGNTVMPPRAFAEVAIGAKGNMGLCTECSYCDYKTECWPEVRGFAYAKGPVWLTKVVEEPKVKEIEV